jgi:hypothetical protein
MKKIKMVLVVMVCLTLTVALGCAQQQMKRTGFLSDYMRLDPAENGLRYINLNRLAHYKQFIIDPVVVHLHEESEAVDIRTRTELANYMHSAIIQAIQQRYMIVSQPATGVARVRVALTDLQKSSPVLNDIPPTKLTGLGLGGASMEGEVLDSLTGEQISAVIQSQMGKRLSFEGVTKWGDAKAVMDGWAKRFRQNLDEAHGY